MAIPGSGTLRFSDINTELCRTSNTANSSLAGGSTVNYTSLFGIANQYGSINRTSPHSMSEFYNYTSIPRSCLVFAYDASNCISYAGSGGILRDFNGSTICGTSTGTIPFTSNGMQSSLHFNGSSNACFVGTTCLKQVTDAITIISVMKTTRLDCRMFSLVKYQFPTQPYGYVAEFGTVSGLWTNTMRFWSEGSVSTRSTDVRGTVQLANNTTYMFTWQYRQSDCQRCMFYNTTVMPYIEANPNYGENSADWAQGNNPFVIGADTVNLGFGCMYNLLVYSKYLSYSEIQQTYNALKTRFGI